MTTAPAEPPMESRSIASERSVVSAAALGSTLSWYDVFLFGSLLPILADNFLAAVDETTSGTLALTAFAASFVTRPLGAIVFGRLGDVLGRKTAFLGALTLMGLSSLIVGLSPTYETVGAAAPVILIATRLLQGLALGGEFGGAAAYVAERAAHSQRGLYTSGIPMAAALGLLLSLAVVLVCRVALGENAFAAWGWRAPFLISLALLFLALWMRLRVDESPVFSRMKEEGRRSTRPLADSFGPNKPALLASIGFSAAPAVILYTGHLYAFFFLQHILKVDGPTAGLLLLAALAIGAPFFVLFGWLSDKVGRKPVILAGCFLAAIGYFPLFEGLTRAANPQLASAAIASPITVFADPRECSLLLDPVGANRFDATSCDVAKSYLAEVGAPYRSQPVLPGGARAEVKIGAQTLTIVDPRLVVGEARAAAVRSFRDKVDDALARAGYPRRASEARMDKAAVVAILTALTLLAAMVCGPLAAALVELSPASVRCTSMSLPYQIANGWFAGFLPAIAFAMVAASGNIYFGLWYPIGVAAATFVVGLLLLPETKHRDISA